MMDDEKSILFGLLFDLRFVLLVVEAALVPVVVVFFYDILNGGGVGFVPHCLENGCELFFEGLFFLDSVDQLEGELHIGSEVWFEEFAELPDEAEPELFYFERLEFRDALSVLEDVREFKAFL